MNRPKRKAFLKMYGCEHTERYIQALETYSKELERKHKDLIHFCDLKMSANYNYKKEIEKLEKALDKAYKYLESYSHDDQFALCRYKEEWKELLMKDE